MGDSDYRQGDQPLTEAGGAGHPALQGSEMLGWSVVANVTEVTHHGDGGTDEQPGLRHFPPGTKVWVPPAQWGDGWDSPVVVGRHRGSPHRYVQMVIEMRHLQDFRVEGVYGAAVQRGMLKPFDRRQVAPNQWQSKEQALAMIERHPYTSQKLRRPD